MTATLDPYPDRAICLVSGEPWEVSYSIRLVATGVLVAGALTAVHTATTGKVFVDLQVYRMGAWAFLHGRSPYGTHLPGPHLPYTYTPFSTVAFAPLSMMPLREAIWAHTLVSLIALFGAVFLVLRELAGTTLSPSRVIRATAAATVALYWSEPVLQTLGFGQVNLVLMGLVVTDLLALRSTRFAGVLIGIAAGIKLTPLVFVLYLFGLRRYRAAVVASLSAAGTVLVGWFLMPGATRLYFTKLAFQARRIGHPNFVANQSVDGALTRLLGSFVAAHPYWELAAVTVLVLGLWTALRAEERAGEPYGLALCALTGLLVSPISWSHHWVWWMVPAVATAWQVYQRRTLATAVLAVTLAIPFYVGPFWRIDPTNFRGPSPVGWQRPMAEAYVLMGLAALVVSAAWMALGSQRTIDRVVAQREDRSHAARHHL